MVPYVCRQARKRRSRDQAHLHRRSNSTRREGLVNPGGQEDTGLLGDFAMTFISAPSQSAQRATELVRPVSGSAHVGYAHSGFARTNRRTPNRICTRGWPAAQPAAAVGGDRGHKPPDTSSLDSAPSPRDPESGQSSPLCHTVAPARTVIPANSESLQESSRPTTSRASSAAHPSSLIAADLRGRQNFGGCERHTRHSHANRRELHRP